MRLTRVTSLIDLNFSESILLLLHLSQTLNIGCLPMGSFEEFNLILLIMHLAF